MAVSAAMRKVKMFRSVTRFFAPRGTSRRRLGGAFALCWLIVAGFGPASAEAAPARHALVIGNAAYQQQPELVNTINDARDVAAKLDELGFDVTRVENTDRRLLTRRINEFLREVRESDGVALLYYSGHGLQVSGQNYLLPVDAQIEDELDVPTEGLALDRVLQGLGDRGDSAVNLIILDSCRDNPYRRSGTRSLGSRGLARMSAPSGTLILYATRPGETASDNPRGRNGLFTKYLLQALDQPGIEVEDAFKEVARNVRRESGKTQLPWQEGLILGRFSFRPQAPPSTLAQPAPPPLPTTGHLQVNVNAPASIRLNGRPVGQAEPGKPLNLKDIPIGEHRVEASADGFTDTAASASVQRNRWTQSVLALKRKVEPPRPTMPTPVLPPVPTPVVEPPRPMMSTPVLPPVPTPVVERHAPASETTRLPLTVTTEPSGARVRILNIVPKYRDGIELEPGKYRIEVYRSGYQQQIQWVELTAQAQTFHFKLQPIAQRTQASSSSPYRPPPARSSTRISKPRPQSQPQSQSQSKPNSSGYTTEQRRAIELFDGL